MEQFVNQFIVSFSQATPSAGGGMGLQFLLMLPLLGILYFLTIRPQQKKQKEHQEMLKKLKVGDRVLTTSGMFAKVTFVDPAEKMVRVEVAPRVEVELVRSAVATIITDQAPATDAK